MKLKRRLKPEAYRDGQAQKLLDAMQELISMKSRKDLYLPIKTNDISEECTYNPKVIDEMMNILHEIRAWDITEVGNLYLTTGGRVVLDKGYGEYFTEGDRVILTREQLHSGIRYNEFLKILKREIEERKKAGYNDI